MTNEKENNFKRQNMIYFWRTSTLKYKNTTYKENKQILSKQSYKLAFNSIKGNDKIIIKYSNHIHMRKEMSIENVVTTTNNKITKK